MSACPACSAPLVPTDVTCARCGVVPARFHGKGARGPRPAALPPPPRAAPAGRRGGALGRLLLVAVLGVAGGGGVVGGYWHLKVRPRLASLDGRYPAPRPGRWHFVRLSPGSGSLGATSGKLPGEPIGLAWDGDALVAANRVEPWGFLRLRPTEDGLDAQVVPVIETFYGQQVGFSGVTWNGSHFVAFTDGAWFQEKVPLVFTVHDRDSLAVVDVKRAPDGIGAIAWDGTGYWAATRNATSDDQTPPRLYRLDASLDVVEEIAGGTAGCQGLAWDGSALWAVDVFSEQLVELDPTDGSVRQGRELPLAYLSGVAWDGRQLWLGDYQEGTVHAVADAVLAAWTGRAPAALTRPGLRLAEAEDDRAVAAVRGGASEDDPEVRRLLAQLRAEPYRWSSVLAELRQRGAERAAVPVLHDMLWADEGGTRFGAELALRELGLPKTRDRKTSFSSTPEREPDDTELVDLRVGLEDGDLIASWTYWFGEDLFDHSVPEDEGVLGGPRFARYTLEVEGAGLRSPVELEYEARPGDNHVEGEVLARDLPAGEYSVTLFGHVQYTQRSGGLRILNDNAAWLQVAH